MHGSTTVSRFRFRPAQGLRAAGLALAILVVLALSPAWAQDRGGATNGEGDAPRWSVHFGTDRTIAASTASPRLPLCVDARLEALDVRGFPAPDEYWILPGGARLDGNPATVPTSDLGLGTHAIGFFAENVHGLASRTLDLAVVEPAFLGQPLAQLQQPLEILFDANTEGATEWRWTWGDGTSTTWLSGCDGSNPTYTYPEPGTYEVRVEARNCQGTTIETTLASVQVSGEVSATLFRPLGCSSTFACEAFQGQVVFFEQQITGSPTAYAYDWDGDGIDDVVSSQPLVAHIFQENGFYNPRLTVYSGVVSSTIASPQVLVAIDTGYIRADSFESGSLGEWWTVVPASALQP